jgi:hypothetical protein
MNQHIKDTGHFIVEEAKKLLARGVLWGIVAVFVFAMTPLWDKMTALWNSTDDIASIRKDIHDLQLTLRNLTKDVARATGEDRVIRQIPGLSYVKEPVHSGEEIVFFLTVQRTRLGAMCKFLVGTPLFTDETGIISAGEQIPATLQLGTEVKKLRLNLIPPDNLKPGRVELYLALEYNCGGVQTQEKTDPIAFNLLPKEEK